MIRVIDFLKGGMTAISDAFESFTDTMKDFSNSLKRAQKDLKSVFDEESFAYYSSTEGIETQGGGGVKKLAVNTLAQLLLGQEEISVSAVVRWSRIERYWPGRQLSNTVFAISYLTSVGYTPKHRRAFSYFTRNNNIVILFIDCEPHRLMKDRTIRSSVLNALTVSYCI